MASIWKPQSRKKFKTDWLSVTSALRPRTKRLPSVWAAQERMLAAGDHTLGTENIRYTHALMPHCVEPMDTADDARINTIVLWLSIRDGKTGSVCMNVIGRTVTDDPGGVYSVHPISDDCDRFNATTVEPTIRATPALSNCFVEAKSRDAGRTKEFKRFAGGWLRIVSAGSLTKFRGTSVKVLCLHELDKLEPESIYAALGRTTGFPDAIRILESTGTYETEIDQDGKKIYRSAICEWFEKGDMRKWFCACRKCGKLQWLKFARIAHTEKKSGESYFYLCEHCEADHNEKQWRKMAASGMWFPTAGLSADQEKDIEKNHALAKAADPTIRSYWRNGFASLLPKGKGYTSKLHQFAIEEQRSRSSSDARYQWVTEVASELYNPAEQDEPPPEWRPLYDGRETYEKVPKAALVICGMVDVQNDRLEILYTAFAKTGESWALSHEVLDGGFRSLDTWQRLAEKLKAAKFTHETGVVMRPDITLLDSGVWSEWIAGLFVFKTLRAPENQILVGKVRCSKGVGAPNLRIIAGPWGKIGHGLRGVHIGTWEAKDTIYARLRGGKDADAPMHFNETFDERFFQQATCEGMVMKFLRGQMVKTYDNPKGLRNEGLDLLVGCLAAFRLRRWNFDEIEGKLKADAAALSDPIAKNKVVVAPGEASGIRMLSTGFAPRW